MPTEYRENLTGLLMGQIRPSKIVGTGYKNPKQVASGWLRTQMHNETNPNQKVCEIKVSASGAGFISELKAKKCQTFKALENGTLSLLNEATVTEFGVQKALYGDGYEVFINWEYINQK